MRHSLDRAKLYLSSPSRVVGLGLSVFLAESLRRFATTPDAIRVARRLNRFSSRLSAEQRLSLDYCLACIDSISGGRGCLRTALCQILLDRSSSGVPVCFGLTLTRRARSGHAWLANRPGANHHLANYPVVVEI